MTLKIRTTEQVTNTVVLNCINYVFSDGMHLMFMCNKRQASDILIKIAMNPIFSKIDDISVYKRLDTYFIELIPTEPFKISLSGVLE